MTTKSQLNTDTAQVDGGRLNSITEIFRSVLNAMGIVMDHEKKAIMQLQSSPIQNNNNQNKYIYDVSFANRTNSISTSYRNQDRNNLNKYKSKFDNHVEDLLGIYETIFAKPET